MITKEEYNILVNIVDVATRHQELGGIKLASMALPILEKLKVGIEKAEKTEKPKEKKKEEPIKEV